MDLLSKRPIWVASKTRAPHRPGDRARVDRRHGQQVTFSSLLSGSGIVPFVTILPTPSKWPSYTIGKCRGGYP